MSSLHLDVARYDLTLVIGTYFDRHLIFPLLEFLETRNIYPNKDILIAQLDLLSKTTMADFESKVYKRLHNIPEGQDPPIELINKRQEVLAVYKAKTKECEKWIEIFNTKDDKKHSEKNILNIEYLKNNYDIKDEDITNLYKYAKFLYDCGLYNEAAKNLYYFIKLFPNHSLTFFAMWGKLACETLVNNWSTAYEDLSRLRDAIEDNSQTSQQTQLEQRTWLMHWGLYIWFNDTADGRTKLIEFFMDEKYLSTICISCPHLLRYLVICVIISKRSKPLLNDIIDLIKQESYTYSDPIIELFKKIYNEFQFEEAAKLLVQCEMVVSHDFFTEPITDEFLDNARVFFFETYFRIHKYIDIPLLSRYLNLSVNNSEIWIADYIRRNKYNAKIDSQTARVVIADTSRSLPQSVFEKTKHFQYKTSQMSNFLNK